MKNLKAFVRAGKSWVRVPIEEVVSHAPQKFTTCYTNDDVGELYIEWGWQERPHGAWTPVAVRAVMQPALFVTVDELANLAYNETLAEVARLLGECDVPAVMPCIMHSVQ